MIDHAKQYEPANYNIKTNRLILYLDLTDEGRAIVDQLAAALQAGQRKWVEKNPPSRKSPQLLGTEGARELAMALLSARWTSKRLERK